MNQFDLIALLLEASNLKRLPRAGWLLRGVPHAESVADHSYATALTALAMVETLNASSTLPVPINLEHVLVIAVLHDLAEARLTDLPASAQLLIPGEVKRQAEAQAMADLLAALPHRDRLLDLWHEFEDESTSEGRLVRDADKIEMMAQCLRYELSGSRGLDDFWRAADVHEWHYPLSADLYARLKAMRPVQIPTDPMPIRHRSEQAQASGLSG